ncbi:hypothetical protein BpHYR1_043338 [Brachionus plicatilis]|uniref:Uncharacterized protein n=1 Tax=Brachionus plicatilis TaxID=10195 RepID=A0A3M7QHK8_BRAPC|nr:hypothetical protein BpHYR1_043338 [Brachionus plicatilis]
MFLATDFDFNIDVHEKFIILIHITLKLVDWIFLKNYFKFFRNNLNFKSFTSYCALKGCVKSAFRLYFLDLIIKVSTPQFKISSNSDSQSSLSIAINKEKYFV